MEKVKKRLNFTEGKFVRNMLAFALPIMISTLLQLLFNAADIAIVGKMSGGNGTTYQAAVGSTGSIIYFIVNLFVGISVGANVAMATAYGAKDEEKQHRVVHSSMAISLVGGIFVAALGISLASPILRLLKTETEVLPYAVLYMQLYFIGAPANVVYNFAASIFRGVGETKKPLYYLFVSGVVNVIINIVTVVFLDMHIVGVALGTVVSQYVAAACVLFDLIREKSGAKYSPKKTRFYKKETKNILFLGIPSGISSCCFSLANMLMQSAVNTYGTIIVAGNTVSMNVDGFVDAVGASFGQAAVTAVGQNVGAKKYDRLKKAIGAGLFLCVVSNLICSVFMLFCGKYVYGLYNSDTEVVKAALVRMRFTTLFYATVAIMQIYGSALRGIGYSLLPMFVNLFCTCLFRVLWVAFIYPIKPCIEMIHVLFPITWVLSGVVQMILYYICERRFLEKQNKFKSVGIKLPTADENSVASTDKTE